MSYINIKNTESVPLSLQFAGEMYHIGAGETKSFPENVAKQWLFIYGFMKEAAAKEVEKIVEKVGEVEEVEEPKKKVTKK